MGNINLDSQSEKETMITDIAEKIADYLSTRWDSWRLKYGERKSWEDFCKYVYSNSIISKFITSEFLVIILTDYEERIRVNEVNT